MQQDFALTVHFPFRSFDLSSFFLLLFEAPSVSFPVSDPSRESSLSFELALSVGLELSDEPSLRADEEDVSDSIRLVFSTRTSCFLSLRSPGEDISASESLFSSAVSAFLSMTGASVSAPCWLLLFTSLMVMFLWVHKSVACWWKGVSDCRVNACQTEIVDLFIVKLREKGNYYQVRHCMETVAATLHIRFTGTSSPILK